MTDPAQIKKSKFVVRSRILHQQKAWAKRLGIEMERPDYTSLPEGNLFRPLSEASSRELGSGRGGELGRRSAGAVPAKFHALHSSSALVANVFDYWRDVDPAALASAFDLDVPIATIRMEAPFSTGYGFPCNLDLVLSSPDDDWILAVESKFMEPFGTSKPGLKIGYVPLDGDSAWKKRKLPRCDHIARSIQAEPGLFQYLDVPQLLKHILGLHRKMENRFRLLYLYYDVDGPAGDAHRDEVATFAKMIGDEVDFQSMSYQGLVSRLKSAVAGTKHDAYFAYLRDRYDLE